MVKMPMAKNYFLNGSYILLQFERVSYHGFSPPGIKEVISMIRFDESRKSMLSQSHPTAH